MPQNTIDLSLNDVLRSNIPTQHLRKSVEIDLRKKKNNKDGIFNVVTKDLTKLLDYFEKL